MFQEPLVRCPRDIITFHNLRPHPFLLDQLFVGNEEVFVQAPFVPVQVLKHSPLRFRPQTFVFGQSPHMRPVFLFDVRVVIFHVGTPSGELDVPLDTVSVQLPVDELAAIVGVDSQQGERQVAFDPIQTGLNVSLRLAQNGGRFRPLTGNVRIGNSPYAAPCNRRNSAKLACKALRYNFDLNAK